MVAANTQLLVLAAVCVVLPSHAVDPTPNSWQQVSRYPSPRVHPACVGYSKGGLTYDDDGYFALSVIGGFGTQQDGSWGYLADAWVGSASQSSANDSPLLWTPVPSPLDYEQATAFYLFSFSDLGWLCLYGGRNAAAVSAELLCTPLTAYYTGGPFFNGSQWSRPASVDDSTASVSLPPPRFGHAAVLTSQEGPDENTGQVTAFQYYVFGGKTTNGSLLGDMWQFSINVTPNNVTDTWVITDARLAVSAAEIASCGLWPAARIGSVLVSQTGLYLSPVRLAILFLFGGQTTDNNGDIVYLSDVWQFSFNTMCWGQVLPAGQSVWPSPRAYHAAALVMPSLFQGFPYGGFLVAGGTNGVLLADVFMFTYATFGSDSYWSQLPDLSIARSGHCAVPFRGTQHYDGFDCEQGCGVVVFGGETISGVTDTYEWQTSIAGPTLPSWVLQSPAQPNASLYGACVAPSVDILGARQVAIFGGSSSNGVQSGEWTLDTSSVWLNQGNGGYPSTGAACAFANMQYVSFGGWNSSALTNGLYVTSEDDMYMFCQLAPIGDIPTPRMYHSLVLLPNSMFVLFAGTGPNGPLDDLHLLYVDPSAASSLCGMFGPTASNWTRVGTAGSGPAARYGHTATMVGTEMIVIGGVGNSLLLRDMWILDTIVWDWTEVTSCGGFQTADLLSAPPADRYLHTSVSLLNGTTSTILVVFGGQSAVGYLSDVWVYFLDSDLWIQGESLRGPLPRSGHLAFSFYGDVMDVMFGLTPTGVADDRWTYVPPTLPDPPTNVQLYGTIGGFAVVQWDAPSSSGGTPLSYFQLQFTDGSVEEGGQFAFNVSANATSFSVPWTELGVSWHIAVTIRAVSPVGVSFVSSSNVIVSPIVVVIMVAGSVQVSIWIFALIVAVFNTRFGSRMFCSLCSLLLLLWTASSCLGAAVITLLTPSGAEKKKKNRYFRSYTRKMKGLEQIGYEHVHIGRAYLLWGLVGLLGAHRFYLFGGCRPHRLWESGWLMALTCWSPFAAVIWFFDGFRLPSLADRALIRRYEDGLRQNELQPLMKGRRKSIPEMVIPTEDLLIEKKLGAGGFGVVMQAFYAGAKVAVKQLHTASLDLTDDWPEKFTAEARIMINLRHVNVVRLLGITLEPYGLVLELISRGSLDGVLAKMPAGFGSHAACGRKIGFLRDVAAGMAYLHANSIIHRDLKSMNLLCTDEYTLKVTDFGTSRIMDRRTTMTFEDNTPGWTAPEILRRETYSEKADVYSCAVVMWEIAACKVPYDSYWPAQIVLGVATARLRPPVDVAWPKQYVDAMERCWSEDAAERPSFEALAEIARRVADVLCPEDPWSNGPSDPADTGGPVTSPPI